MASIQQVVLRRVNEMKPILFTSDLTPEEMARRWMQAGITGSMTASGLVPLFPTWKGESKGKEGVLSSEIAKSL